METMTVKPLNHDDALAHAMSAVQRPPWLQLDGELTPTQRIFETVCLAYLDARLGIPMAPGPTAAAENHAWKPGDEAAFKILTVSGDGETAWVRVGLQNVLVSTVHLQRPSGGRP